jgi:hypothetical protein
LPIADCRLPIGAPIVAGCDAGSRNDLQQLLSLAVKIADPARFEESRVNGELKPEGSLIGLFFYDTELGNEFCP